MVVYLPWSRDTGSRSVAKPVPLGEHRPQQVLCVVSDMIQLVRTQIEIFIPSHLNVSLENRKAQEYLERFAHRIYNSYEFDGKMQ